MPHPKIESIKIRGFRSLVDVELVDLPDVTVLIGPNGSGKSSVLRFFEMMNWMLRSSKLGEYVARQGGADDQMFGGAQVTSRLSAEIGVRAEAGLNEYGFDLVHGHPDRFVFTDERIRFTREGRPDTPNWQHLGTGHVEAFVVEAGGEAFGPGFNPTTARSVAFLMRDMQVFHFHDTSDTSRMKMKWDASDTALLRNDGGNLAPVLLRLKRDEPKRYLEICRIAGWMVPGFEEFVLREEYGKVLLRWRSGHFDKVLGPHLTSDGSLRLFALTTLLTLPEDMLPHMIMLDEPELGLHPSAISLVAEMIKSIGIERQVIVATQSPLFVDGFEIENLFVAELTEGRTSFRRHGSEDFKAWLDDYATTGDLWMKNLLGGRP